MEQIMNYIKPELVVLIIVLYFIGMALKKSQKVTDANIPFWLGGIGIVLCALWVLATSPLGTPQDVAIAVFTAIVQGVLVAGTSVYFNQLKVQQSKKTGTDETTEK